MANSFKKTKKDIVFIDLTPVDQRLLTVHSGIRSLASFLREKGLSAEILFNLKQNLTIDQTLSFFSGKVAESRPLFLGFSPYQSSSKYPLSDLSQIERIIKELKKKKVTPYVILGGHFASFEHQNLMRDFPWIDLIVRGEGEKTLEELVHCVKEKRNLKDVAGITYREREKIIENGPREPIENLDSLPIPALDHLDYAANQGMRINKYFIYSSRGCYGNCSFCSIQSFYRLSSSFFCWRGRSPRKVVDEMEYIINRYNCRNFGFYDDNFMGPGEAGKERARGIAREILKRGLKLKFDLQFRANDIDENTIKLLKKAGLTSVCFGIESGSENGLLTYSKGVNVEQNRKAIKLIDRLGLMVLPGMIFLNPYSTVEELKENIEFYRFADSLKKVYWPNEAALNSLVPFSGTSIKERLEKDGLLRGNYIDGYSYAFIDKRLEYIKEISDKFEQLTAHFDSFIENTYWIEIRRRKEPMLTKRGLSLPIIKRIVKIKTKVLFYMALKSIERVIKILESSEPEKIKGFVAEQKIRLAQIKDSLAGHLLI